MSYFTREEQITCAIARSFSENDNFCAVATCNSGSVALALAKELYAPKLSLVGWANGRYCTFKNLTFPHIPGSPPKGSIETTFDSDEAFSLVVRGKWFVIMQAVQIYQYGYSNLSLIGRDKSRPTQVFVGSRGVPTNTVVMPRTLYFSSNHSSRLFVEQVDFRSGLGYGSERKCGDVKWGQPIEIITNLCVLDFEPNSGRARLRSLHEGVSLDEVIENTGFELILPKDVPMTVAPSDAELDLIRNEIDPAGVHRLDFLRGEHLKAALGEIAKYR